jgi:hypothetical protein
MEKEYAVAVAASEIFGVASGVQAPVIIAIEVQTPYPLSMTSRPPSPSGMKKTAGGSCCGRRSRNQGSYCADLAGPLLSAPDLRNLKTPPKAPCESWSWGSRLGSHPVMRLGRLVPSSPGTPLPGVHVGHLSPFVC